jgi:hypothetical protein
MDCPAFSDIPKIPNVRLFRLPKMTIGEKRNIGVSRAEGDVICHWDSDDWNPSTRIANQLHELLASGKRVSGCSQLLFWDLDLKHGYRYTHPHPAYAIGTTLMYHRSWSLSHPFPASNIGEDNLFVHQSRSVLHTIPDLGIIAGVHSGNTSKKVLSHAEFAKVPLTAFPNEAHSWMHD